MAETEWLIPRAPRFGDVEAEKARDDDAEGIGLSDIAKEGYAGLKEGVGQIASAAGRAGLSDMGEVVGEDLRRSAERTRSTESARARRYRESAFVGDGSGPALSDPDTSLAGAIAIKGAGMVGSMAPVIGGAVAGGVVAGPPGALAAGAALGGAQQAGGHVQRLRDEIERASPDLLNQSKAYRAGSDAAEQNGATDAEADRAGREAMFQEADANGWRSLAQFGIGAVGGAAGATPRIAAGVLGRGGSRALGGALGGAEKGALRRAGIGAAEEAAVNGAQGAASEAITQDAEIDARLRTGKDGRAILNAGVEGAVMGAAIGAPAGVISGRGAGRSRGVEATPDGVGAAEASAVADNGAIPMDNRAGPEPLQITGPGPDIAALRRAVAEAKTPDERVAAIRALRRAGDQVREGEAAGEANARAMRPDVLPNDAPIERNGGRSRRATLELIEETDNAKRLRDLLSRYEIEEADPSNVAVRSEDGGVSATGTEVARAGRDLTAPGSELEVGPEYENVARLRALLGREIEDAEWSEVNRLPPPARALPAPDAPVEAAPAALTETRRLPAPEREPVLADEARAPEPVNPEPDPDTADSIQSAAEVTEPVTPEPAPARGRAKTTEADAITVREDGTRVLRNPEEVAAERESLRRSAGGLAERTMGAVETNTAKLEAEGTAMPFLRRASKAVASLGDEAQPWHRDAHEAAQEKASYGLKGSPPKDLRPKFKELNARIERARQQEIEHARGVERAEAERDAADRAAVESTTIGGREGEAAGDRDRLRRQAESARHDKTARTVLDANPIENKVLNDIVRAKPVLDSEGVPYPVAPGLAALRAKMQDAAIGKVSQAIRSTLAAAREAGVPVRQSVRGGDPAHLQWLAHLSGLEAEMDRQPGKRLTVAQAIRFAEDERLGRSGRYAEIATQNDLDSTLPGRTVAQESAGGVDRVARQQDRAVAEAYRSADEPAARVDEDDDGGAGARAIAEREAAVVAARREAARAEGAGRSDAPARPAPKVETVRRRTPAAEAAIAKSRAKTARLGGQGELALSRNIETVRKEARRSTVDPTPAQAEAGNYRKPRFEIPVEGREALSLRIETAKGRERRGIGDDGRPWAHALPHDYGYLEGTRDNTGEPIDVHLGPNLKSDRVFVVDQQRLTDGKPSGYDEPKVMLGFDNRREAERAYVQGFGDGKGRARMGAVREFTKAEFEDWARSDAPAEDRGAAPKGDEPRARRSPVTYDAIGNESVRAAAGFVEALHDRFGVDARVHVVEANDRDQVNGYLRRRRDGSYEIGIHSDRPTASIAETVAHEYGHLLERELLDHATAEEKSAVGEAYAAYLARTRPDLRAADVMDHQTPMHIARYLDEGVPLDGKVTDAYRDYYTSFPEWFAREVALHLTGKPETQGLAGRFFARVAETWRSLVGLLKGHPVASREVAEFLDRYARPDSRPASLDERLAQMGNQIAQDNLALRRAAGRLEQVLAPDGIRYSLSIPEGLSAAARDRLKADTIGISRFGIKASTTAGLEYASRGKFVRAGKDLYTAAVAIGQRMGGIRNAALDPHARFSQRFAEMGRENFERASDIMSRATMLDVNLLPGRNRSEADIRAANRHLGGDDNLRTLKSRSELVAAQRDFESLPNDVRKAVLDYGDLLKQQHVDLIQKALESTLATTDLTKAEKDTLIKRAMNGVLREEDARTVDDENIFAALKDLSYDRNAHGMYFPLSRQGDHVVQTLERLGDLRGGRQVGENGVAFTGKTQAEARAKAEAFIKGSDLLPTSTEHQVFDRATGDRLKGTDIGEHEGETDHTYVVRMQREGFHTFETRTEAVTFIRKANEAGTFEKISAEPIDKLKAMESKEFTPAHVRELMAGLDRVPPEKMSAPERQVYRNLVMSTVARASRGNSFAKHSIARQNTLGMSRDLPRNILQYGSAYASNHVAMTVMPEVRGLFTEMHKVIEDAGINHPMRGERSALLAELERRFERGNTEPNAAPEFVKRLLGVSQIAHLASLSTNIMNATQVGMITQPHLAGKFGTYRASASIAKAYADIGIVGTLKNAGVNTWRAFSGKLAIDVNDPVGSVKAKLAQQPDGANLHRMLDHLIQQGALDAGAEFEFVPSLARGDRGLRRFEVVLDRFFRQMPASIEALNRSVTAVSAYRLARESGMNHADATTYAHDTVIQTQFDYSNFNTAPWMKHPGLSWAVQFHRYGAAMYGMLWRTIKPIVKWEKEGKVQALRAMTNMMAMQIVVGGALGLPGMELVKVGATLGSMLLGTPGSDDVERRLKALAIDAFGHEWGTAFSKGLLSRALGVDVSSRASYADLIFGDPRSDMSTTAGQFEYIGRALIGAPGGMALDFAEGVRALADGDILKGASKMIPIKTVGDIIKGQDEYERGKISRGEQALRSIGFRSARAADKGEEIGDKKAAREALTKEKLKLDRAIVLARTPRERAIAVSQAKSWNTEHKASGVHVNVRAAQMRAEQARQERIALQGE